jgi:hypothetical protein
MVANPPWRQLMAQLRLPYPPPQAVALCAQQAARLPLFITDELAGQPVDLLYPETAQHLDICPDCLAEYESLSKLTLVALYGKEAL